MTTPLVDTTERERALAELLKREEVREIRAARVAERQAIVAHLDSQGIPSLPKLDMTTVFDEDAAEQWLIEPLVTRGGLTQLSSSPGEGKSILMFDLVMALCNADRRVLGAPVPEALRVLVVDFENSKPDYSRWLRNLGYTPDPKHYANLHYVTMPSAEALNTPRGGATVLRTALEHDADLVVIDTLSRSIDGDENDASTFLNWYRHCGMPLKRHGIATIRLDHLGKSAEKGARGSSAKMGDVDLAWELRHSDAATYRLVCTKHRMPLAEEHLAVNRINEVWEGDVLRTPLEHRVVVGVTEHQARVDAVLEALDSAAVPVATGVVRIKAMKAAGELQITAGSAAIEEAVRRRKAVAGVLDEDHTPDGEEQ